MSHLELLTYVQSWIRAPLLDFEVYSMLCVITTRKRNRNTARLLQQTFITVRAIFYKKKKKRCVKNAKQ